MTLFRQHARNEAVSVLIWAVLMGIFSFGGTYLWDLMRTSGSLADLQKALGSSQGVIKAMVGVGGSLTSLDGWIQGYVLGSWISLLYVTFTALFVVGIVTREMDRRTIEFLLSLPVSRTKLLLSRWGVLAVSLGAIHLLQFIGVWSAVAALGQPGHPGRYALASLNSLLLYLFLGSLLLLISLFVDDYGPGTGAVLGVGLGLNLAYMGLTDATGALQSLREALPFAWYDVQAIIGKGTVPWAHMAILAFGALLFLGLSVWAFQRKQIAV